MVNDPMVTCERLPSEYWHEHCYLTFIDDLPGVMLRKFIGVDRIMWSSDFPHLDSSWPESQQFLDRHLADVPEAEARPIIAENCVRLYHLG
jgi:predicted TIM-barrel fold metal-dependent hydrolase